MDIKTYFHIDPISLDFDLPDGLIAQEPLAVRDQAKLMVLDRQTGALTHHHFYDVSSFLRGGDVLVLNRTKVKPAKLFGHKTTGGKVEVILIAPFEGAPFWKALLRPRMKEGTEFTLGESNSVRLVKRLPTGENILDFKGTDPNQIMQTQGVLPLPPYIKRGVRDPRISDDRENYQTVYSKEEGSLAAPTAGLHFTGPLIETLKMKGVQIVEILLHVGWGTFKPIATDLSSHEMLPEYYEVGVEGREMLRRALQEKRRIISVGTTSTRVLETLTPSLPDSQLKGKTNLFIKPGFSFSMISGLITNFHVPRSTPIALTAAFAGLDQLEKAYEIAIERQYRFFSYGDAMLVI